MVQVPQQWHVQIYSKKLVFPQKILLWLTEQELFTEVEKNLNQWKSAYAIETTNKTLGEAIVGCLFFLGLSAKGALTKDMVKKMAKIQ